MLLTELRKIILFFKRKNCPKSNNGADDISRRGYCVRRITFQWHAYMLAPRLHQHRNVVRIRYLINEYPHEDFHSKIGRRNMNI